MKYILITSYLQRKKKTGSFRHLLAGETAIKLQRNIMKFAVVVFEGTIILLFTLKRTI